LREALGVTTELDYHLLSFDVFRAWKVDSDVYSAQTPLGATDDLRYGMALNPHMRVWIVHGHYDLVTPYFSSRRLAGLMKLLPEGRERLRVESFKGGHMFYAWDESRERFFDAATGFFRG
jgi:carboxypeptidase C (cathepsin A)